MDFTKNPFVNFYQHYKYYHFYSICFGLGLGTALYTPFHPIKELSHFAAVFTIIFECAGFLFDIPAHTRTCKGCPYDRTDVCLGFFSALLMAFLNRKCHNACPLSYGCGLMVFAISGAIRKCSSLRRLKKGQRPWR